MVIGSPRNPDSEGKLEDEEIEEADAADFAAGRTGHGEHAPVGHGVTRRWRGGVAVDPGVGE